ncbi:MAG: hypothetical protein HWN67_23565 [Candidatus Helarchaeota archaeon]|nr:hypothetical protein [Candidatus Helarchaeota archaeon]
MKKRNISTLIIAGFLVVPIFISLYGVSNSYCLPIAIPNLSSFQLSSATSFQQTMNISPQDPNLSELESKIAIDKNNIIHLVYVNSSNGNDIVYSNSTNFSVVQRVSNNTDQDKEPAIAVNSNNCTVYIVWTSHNGSLTGISLSKGSNFSINQTISYNGTSPDIAIDNAGVVHIVWNQKTGPAVSNTDIWYTNSDNYTKIIEITNNSDSNENPSIAVDFKDNVHIVWSGNNDIFYANSTNNFAANATVSQNTGEDQVPDIIATNSVHIVWQALVADYKIYLATKNSTNHWENQTISNNINNNSNPTITKGPGGLLHIIWANGSQRDLIYTDQSDDFVTNTTIFNNMTFTSGYAGDIAIDKNGRVHIIWLFENQTYYKNSIYPDYPAVRMLKSTLIPLDLNTQKITMIAMGEFFDEFWIKKVELMWSINAGASWNTLSMIGSGNGTKFTGISAIPGFEYGVVLLFKYNIIDKTGLEHETSQMAFYYPDTHVESIILIIIVIGILVALTALYLIPQTRNFMCNLFKKNQSKINIEPKKTIDYTDIQKKKLL